MEATPGSSANGCGLGDAAGAWRQRATQLQETQPRLEPKNQCVHFVVSFTFFPLLGNKLKRQLENQACLPPPKSSRVGPRAELKGSRLCTRGGWFPWVGTEAHRQEMPTVPQPWGEGNDTGLTAAMTAATPPQTCWAVTLGRRKTQNKFHVVFPTWWLHPILGLSQACHPLSRSHGK